ncbi:hypothetical protein DFH27DRAFT_616943 [Peziza echinospora]|nr:hypothetical protein DFH27DRAFT_616943 [Peziza echinospora]
MPPPAPEVPPDTRSNTPTDKDKDSSTGVDCHFSPGNADLAAAGITKPNPINKEWCLTTLRIKHEWHPLRKHAAYTIFSRIDADTPEQAAWGEFLHFGWGLEALDRNEGDEGDEDDDDEKDEEDRKTVSSHMRNVLQGLLYNDSGERHPLAVTGWVFWALFLTIRRTTGKAKGNAAGRAVGGTDEGSRGRALELAFEQYSRKHGLVTRANMDQLGIVTTDNIKEYGIVTEEVLMELGGGVDTETLMEALQEVLQPLMATNLPENTEDKAARAAQQAAWEGEAARLREALAEEEEARIGGDGEQRQA